MAGQTHRPAIGANNRNLDRRSKGGNNSHNSDLRNISLHSKGGSNSHNSDLRNISLHSKGGNNSHNSDRRSSSNRDNHNSRLTVSTSSFLNEFVGKQLVDKTAPTTGNGLSARQGTVGSGWTWFAQAIALFGCSFLHSRKSRGGTETACVGTTTITFGVLRAPAPASALMFTLLKPDLVT